MSLPLIAKHLEQHGRGEDTHLVHMTTGELQAMQKMAEQHGGSLTINPHTGLPEAGFLSSALPMVLGAAAAMTGQEWAVPLAMAMSAGGEYAMTGSLTQGLMAGLGAWGGAGLASGIAGLGADAAAAAVPATADIAEPIALNTTQEGLAATNAAEDSAGYAGNNINGVANQVPGTAPYSSVPSTAGSSSTFSQNMSNFGKGLTSGNLMDYAGSHLGQVASVALPLASSATNLFKQPTVPTATTTGGGTNPFGMKTIPKDANGNPIFNASIPAVPSPHYQATYPNYVQNPYQPTMAASGGLMDIPKYSGADYGSMVTGANEMQQGLAQATSPQQLSELQKELIAAGQESSKNGVYTLSDTEYAKMTPAALMKKYKIALAKGVEPVGTLGDYETKPSAQAAAEQAAQADIAQSQQKTSAKEGGLMAMAAGGTPLPGSGAGGDFKPTGGMISNALVGMGAAGPSHIYTPQYTNYQQTPFNIQQAMRSYNPQVAPAGLPTVIPQQAMPQSTGYKIDPTTMIGSPVYKQQQDQLAAAQAQAQAAQDALNSYRLTQAAANSNEAGASGGLPKDFKHHYAAGGMSNLGGYSDGGHLLKGPGDGVSDGIPAVIGGKQPARLADGEFVIPARIVSELGNGSTDAGAKRLYAMMDRIKHARAKAKDIAADTKAYKYLPA